MQVCITLCRTPRWIVWSTTPPLSQAASERSAMAANVLVIDYSSSSSWPRCSERSSSSESSSGVLQADRVSSATAAHVSRNFMRFYYLLARFGSTSRLSGKQPPERSGPSHVLRCSAFDRQSDFACAAIVAGYRAAVARSVHRATCVGWLERARRPLQYASPRQRRSASPTTQRRNPIGHPRGPQVEASTTFVP